MKTLEEISNILKDYKMELKERYKIKEIGIFGSYIKNEQTEISDIDILVEFDETLNLIKFINLENYLSDILGIKVDLILKKALKKNIGRSILKEVVII